MTAQPIAWSLAQMLLAALRETDAGTRRGDLLSELSAAVEHLAPNVRDLSAAEARAALARVSLDSSADHLAASAIAASMPARHDHVVRLNSAGSGACPHRFECSCGNKGAWHYDPDRAVAAGARHVEFSRLRSSALERT